jgi:hypothetical protein
MHESGNGTKRTYRGGCPFVRFRGQADMQSGVTFDPFKSMDQTAGAIRMRASLRAR